MNTNEKQSGFTHHRGDKGAYRRYLDGMDSSMRQKVALVAAHLRAQGRVADMGMGSGTGSQALAALYPSVEVVGVDLDPMMVELASERHLLPNLSFTVGDIATPVFDAGSLEGILDSSVLHHVTSFTGYNYDAAAKALAVQSEQIAENGVLIVRDFLAPADCSVYLDLPTGDGDDQEDPATCSTATLFERFAKEFRSLHAKPGFSFEQDVLGPCPALAPGWRRFKVGLRIATEFILRKDYRRDWVAEVKEEYCYFTQAEFEGVFGRLGLRVLASTPLQNPWILRNRYQGKFLLWSESGDALEFPATNYLIVGEKVATGLGVALREGARCSPTGFLTLEHYRHKKSGAIRDLVRRPHRSLDILPWFERSGDTFILARASYPRPILQAQCDVESLDGARAAGYVTEPLVALQSDRPLGSTVEECLRVEAGVDGERIVSFANGTTYYPSPGGIEEVVTSALVEIEPTFVSRPLENRTGFSSAGRVMAIEAQQLLRSAQVGGLLDARLELNVYELLLQAGRDLGPWIGESISLSEGATSLRGAALEELLARAPRRMFAACQTSGDFLQLRTSRFEELDAQGEVLNSQELEYVVPNALSQNTFACALLYKEGDQVWIGLDDDDLPAAQSFVGNSQLLVAPAWRLPKHKDKWTPALSWLKERLAQEHGLEVEEVWRLGGRYHPSLGATPEVVYPLALQVAGADRESCGLHWVPLASLVHKRGEIQDGHLRIAALRAAHALGLLDS